MFKKYSVTLLLVLFGLTRFVSAEPLDDLTDNPFLQQQDEKSAKKKLPPVNWIRSRKIDVKNVLIDLRIDWDKNQAYGSTAITLAPFNDTDRIAIDAAYMTINSVKTLLGKDLKFKYAGKDSNDNLEIMLDRVYKAGENLTVKIDYRTNYVNSADDQNTAIGSFGRGLRFIKPTADDPTKPYQIWSQGESEFNRYWFPSYDTPNDFRTSEVRVTVDKKFFVVSNGKLISKKPNADGTVTFDWKMDIPYANYLTSIVICEYAEVKSGQYLGIPILAYGYKNETKEVYETTKSVPDMVKFFSEKTGVKYPYPKYSQAMAEDFGGGMENISATTQIEEMIHDSRELLDGDSDSLQSHELAHQWFGDFVTCRDWGQIWLNESFATYFQALYREHSKGHDEFLYDDVYSNQNQYLQTWNQGNRRPIVTKYYDDKDALFDNYAYPRGGAVLHMLRKHLGDAAWWKAINHYLKSNAHQPVSTEEFRLAVEESTGESMDWFFDQWLFKMGHPIFEVTKNYASGKLTLNVKQTQKIDETNEYPQVDFFQGKMDIEIDGVIRQIWIEPKAEQTFTFDTGAEPKIVGFDYEGTWIKEVQFDKSVDELIYQLENDKDALGRRWALSELGKKINSADKYKIMAAIRATATSDTLWQLRSAAFGQIQRAFGLGGRNQQNAPVVKFDEATIQTILQVTKDKKSNIRAAAFGALGASRDEKYASLYLAAISDQSYSVIDNAARALGLSKSPKAYDALLKLVNTESWKGRIKMAGLNGLGQLEDKRGFESAYKIATDKTQSPNIRATALSVVGKIGKGDDRAYPLVFEAFKKSLGADDIQGVFSTASAIASLGDPRGQEAFNLLKEKFGKIPQFAGLINQLETRFKDAMKK